ncbi:pyridoxamine 5'-phosphate oxidase family protein [Streptoalloteichus hindustanus]|uniref:pyridoxamine 5'-phosphate oxidase family protein n=1 Tax=Streptoalloteichus hindustanus TaxID=2017 RepID=UPI00093677A8|nr:pyridoxamine 5'-phosphate oxidase family protein [Streptoalloteichus hindustanus]
MPTRVASFDEIEDEFNRYVREIVYCSLITVDRRGRPRARVLLPIWQVVDGRPVGWIAAYRTPVKTAHLARNPHVTCSYWKPSQNAVFVDSVAGWVEEEHVKREVWELYRKGSPPPVGYDPRHYWPGGPTDPDFGLLRMDPFRVQVLRGADLRSRIWQPPDDEATAL